MFENGFPKSFSLQRHHVRCSLRKLRHVSLSSCRAKPYTCVSGILTKTVVEQTSKL